MRQLLFRYGVSHIDIVRVFVDDYCVDFVDRMQ